jgi:hypothetical protein
MPCAQVKPSSLALAAEACDCSLLKPKKRTVPTAAKAGGYLAVNRMAEVLAVSGCGEDRPVINGAVVKISPYSQPMRPKNFRDKMTSPVRAVAEDDGALDHQHDSGNDHGVGLVIDKKNSDPHFKSPQPTPPPSRDGKTPRQEPLVLASPRRAPTSASRPRTLGEACQGLAV